MRQNTFDTWWTQTSIQGGDTISGTTSETVFASKPNVVPANGFSVGDGIRIRASGVLSTGLTAANFTLKYKAGSVVLVGSNALSVGISLTNKPWRFQADLDVRSLGASGTAVATGQLFISSGAGLAVQDILGNASTVTIDTTADAQLQLSSTMTSLISGNSITLQQFIVEYLRG